MAAEQQDKTIKIKIDTDNPSAQRFNATIASMTASVEKLAQVLDKVTRSMESFSRAQGKTGGPSVGKGGATQGKAGGIAESIIGDSGGVRNAAKVTEAALSSTGNNIKRFVNNAINDMQRLQAATRSIGGGFASSGAGGFGAGGGGYSYGSGFSSSTGAMPFGGGPGGAGGRNYGDFSSFEREIGGIAPPGTSSGGKPAGGVAAFGWRGRAANSLVGGAIGKMFGNGPAGAVIGGMLGETGVSRALAPYMGGIGVGGAILKAYDFAATSFEDTRAGRIKFTLNQPLMALGAAASTASIHHKVFSAAQDKDIASIAAFNATVNDPDIRRSIGSANLNKEALMLAWNQNPVSLSKGSEYVKDVIKGWTGTGAESFANYVSGSKLDPVVQEKLSTLGYMTASYGLVGEQNDKFNTAWEGKKMLQTPMFNMMANRISQEGQSRQHMMWGHGGSTGYTKDGKRLNVEDWLSKITASGWTGEEVNSAYQQFLSFGKGYSGIVGGERGLLGVQMAGLTNLSQLLPMGGMLSGSVAGTQNWYNTLKHSIGRGGLDVAAGKDMFANVGTSVLNTGQFGSGNTAATYLGLAAGLVGGGVDGGSVVADVAGQQRASMILAQGDETFAKFTQGSQAPLYMAASLLGAMGAAGGYNASAEALSRMDPKALTSIARGGEIPGYYRDMPGVTQESARNFLNYQRNSPFFEVIDSLNTGGQGELLGQVRSKMASGGSWIDVLNDKAGGLKGKDRLKARNVIVQELAGIISNSGSGINEAKAEGMLLSQLTQESDWASGLGGNGVGVSKPQGLEADALKAQAALYNQQAKLGSFGSSDSKNLEDVKRYLSELVLLVSKSTPGVLSAAQLAGAQADATANATDSALSMYAKKAGYDINNLTAEQKSKIDAFLNPGRPPVRAVSKR